VDVPRQRVALFSLGRLIERCWPGKPRWLSWVASSSLLTIAACADPMRRGGYVDFVMIGLALYELLIGVLETA
jgi:hypothetical protein